MRRSPSFRGDPNQARLRRCPRQPRRNALRGKSRICRRRSRHIARLSGSSRIRPMLTCGLGNALKGRESWNEAIARIARRHTAQAGRRQSPQHLGIALTTREARRGDRRIPRGDPAQAGLRNAHSNLGNALNDQGKLDEAIAEYRGDPAQARLRRSPQQSRQRPERPGEAGRGDRRIPRPRSGSSPTTPIPTTISAIPDRSGKAGRGDRRIPRGDTAQARLRHRPQQPRQRPEDQGKLDEAIAEYGGDPAQARLTHRPQQSRHRPEGSG